MGDLGPLSVFGIVLLLQVLLALAITAVSLGLYRLRRPHG